MTSALSLSAVAAATAVLGACVHAGLHQVQPPSLTAGLCTGAVAWFVVAGLLGRLCVAYPGERDTPQGKAVASRWLGVQRWLRAQESFAEVPPAGVAVWDRYLPYGAALGVTRVAGRVLDLGAGNRRQRWSSHGGTWHRVRVRYPRLWPHYGKPAGELAKPATKALLLGAVLILFNDAPRRWVPQLLGPQAADPRPYDIFEPLAFLAGTILVALAAVRLLQVLFDVATARTITGTVLWIEPWPTTVLGSAYPHRSYLAIDDGSAVTVTAWALPTHLHCRTNDLARLKVRRWTRRITELELLHHGRTPSAAPALDLNDL